MTVTGQSGHFITVVASLIAEWVNVTMSKYDHPLWENAWIKLNAQVIVPRVTGISSYCSSQMSLCNKKTATTSGTAEDENFLFRIAEKETEITEL